MGVVPIGAAPIAHDEVIFKATIGADGAARMTIHCGRRVQAVPVNDGWFLQLVV